MKLKIMFMMMISFYLLSCSTTIEPVSGSNDGSTVSHSGARTTQVWDFGTQSYITTYDVDPSIINNFQHYWQNEDASKTLMGDYNASISCGPTSYMMVANCLARYKNRTYGVTAAKQKAIADYTGLPANLQKIGYYLNAYDSDFLKYARESISDREVFKTTIETALANNGFVIASLNACVGTNAKYLVHTDPYYSRDPLVNPDLDLPLNTGQKYITSLSSGSTSGIYGVFGHIIIIIAIEKRANGSGIVTYIDPISKTRTTSNRKYVSYTRLLDAIKAGSSNVYQCLRIYNK